MSCSVMTERNDQLCGDWEARLTDEQLLLSYRETGNEAQFAELVDR